mgnify:FL=1
MPESRDIVNTDADQNTERKEKEAAIIRAALSSYARYGLTATTRQIADAAGIGKTTIYEYFKNKDALMEASFQYLLSGMDTAHQSIHKIAREDPAEALRRYLDNAVRISLEEPATLLLISQYSLGILLRTDIFETARAAYREKMYPVMERLIEEFRYIIRRGIGKNVFHLPEDVTAEGMVYTVCALIREIQAQAFLMEGEELSRTGALIKQTVFTLLGVRTPQ